MKNKLLLILGLCILLPNLAYSMTLDELLDSYNLSVPQDYITINRTQTNFFQNVNSVDLIDDNNNGKYEKVLLSLDFNINLSKTYKVEITISNVFNQKILSSSFEDVLTEGINTVEFELRGTRFYESKISGPYYAKSISISDEDGIIESVFDVKLLENVTYDDFELPNLPDLSIKNIVYNQSTGNTSILIKNVGIGDAIGLVVKILDGNFSELGEEMIAVVLSNQTLNLFYVFEKNLTNIYAYVDYYGNVEEYYEFNNELVWPVNLTEICKDGLDNDRDELIDEDCGKKHKTKDKKKDKEEKKEEKEIKKEEKNKLKEEWREEKEDVKKKFEELKENSSIEHKGEVVSEYVKSDEFKDSRGFAAEKEATNEKSKGRFSRFADFFKGWFRR